MGEEELIKLNDYEINTIIVGLKLLAENTSYAYSFGAKVLLEDNAQFVRGLHWTSKNADRKQDV